MLKPYIRAWATQYFFKGLGKEAPATLPNSDEFYENEFRDNFEKYACMFIHNNKMSIDDKEASEFLTELQTLKLNRSIYNLCELKPVEGIEDWRENLRQAVKTFKEDKKPFFARVKDGTDFVTYACNGTITGEYPDDVILLIPNYVKGVDGDCVKYLCSRNPIQMTDTEIKACEAIYQAGWIIESNLRSTSYLMPDGNNFTTKMVNALNIGEVPYRVRKLISTLPDSYIAEYDNQYYAALTFAENAGKEWGDCIDWLNRVNTFSPTVAMQASVVSPTIGGLDDNDVMNYLRDNYNLNVGNLSELAVKEESPIKQIFGTSILLDDEKKSMPAIEFLDSFSENPDVCTSTLDDIIIAYCNDEGIDMNCTIAQLLHYINYECTIAPKTFKEHCIDYKAETSVDGNTTLDEVIANKPHKEVDPSDICMEFIQTSDSFSEEFKTAVKDAILNDTYADFKTPSDIILDMHLPDDITSKLIATCSGVPFELPAPAENLDKHGNASNDAAYMAGESMLYDFRNAVIDHDSMELRESAIPILYSFSRLFMLRAGDKSDARDFLVERQKECKTDETRNFVQKAIDLLT